MRSPSVRKVPLAPDGFAFRFSRLQQAQRLRAPGRAAPEGAATAAGDAPPRAASSPARALPARPPLFGVKGSLDRLEMTYTTQTCFQRAGVPKVAPCCARAAADCQARLPWPNKLKWPKSCIGLADNVYLKKKKNFVGECG